MIHKEQALKKGIKIIDSKESHNALFENLKTHFPQTIKDNQVDLKAIATLLGLETKANIQGYELTFTGKALANALYSTPTQKLLKFEYCFNACNTESVILRKSEISKGLDSQKDISGGRPQYDKVGSHSEALAEESNPIYHSDLERSEREESNSKEDSKAEASCDDFVGCQGGGEGDSHANNIEQDTQRVQDFGDKNGALQSEARELPKVVMTEAETKQSPFLAQKTSTQETMPTTTSQNFIIKGDNLDVLKILKSAYSEKIKMIYIDPPYNTKNENFIYPDNFRKDYKAILQEVGLLEIDDEGNEVESETLRFFKNIQGSRTHSGWLAFMLPRLKLARDLLREDGVIFISIDDNEQANLKILCDEIFGEENFVACMCVESAPAGTQSSNFVAQQHSYCLVYTKSDCDNSLYKIMLTNDELDSKYIQKDEYGEFYIERLWKRGIGGRKEDVPSLHFPVFYDETMDRIYIDDEITESKNFIKIIPYQSAGVLGRWTWSKDKMMAERHRLVVKKVNGEWKLHKKQYKKDEQGKLPNSIIKSEIARTEIGSLELKNLIGEKVFDYPKPISLIKHLLKISTNANAESSKEDSMDSKDVPPPFAEGARGWEKEIPQEKSNLESKYIKENITNKPYHRYLAPYMKEFSRELRKNPTKAESMLWQELRNKKLGVRFRRQFVIDSKYIADFVCLEARLIIECDGGQHATIPPPSVGDSNDFPPPFAEGARGWEKEIHPDRERDFYLQSHNFRILRFWNNEILENLQGVLTKITEVLRECLESKEVLSFSDTHPLAPSAKGGGKVEESFAKGGGKSLESFVQGGGIGEYFLKGNDEEKKGSKGVQDFGDKNGALQGDARELPKAVMTEAETKQSPFLAQKTSPLQEADIILDFFAGSGTTAHAVMELNAEDGGNRKCILVQIDEPINESKNKVAYDFCKKELKSKNPAISDITIERVKRASAKIANINPNFSVSFSVLALSDKPELISTEQGTLELLSNANLSPFDKALNLALQSAKTLDKPLKTIFENRLYQCEDCLYLIACDKEVLEFLRKSQNEYIFIDGFEDLHLEDFLNLDSSLNDRLRVVY